jgi:hypothetical protein
MHDDKISDQELAEWIKEVEAKTPKQNGGAEREPKAHDQKAAQPSPPPDDQHLPKNHDSEVPGTD